MTRNEAEAKARDYYQKRRLKTAMLIDEREAEAVKKIPGFKELLNERASLPLKSLRQAMAEPERAQEISLNMRESGLKLNQKIRDALTSNGYPENYLQPAYECEICRDTGYVYDAVPAVTCKCFEKRVYELLRESMSDGLYAACFEDFDEGFIPDSPIAEGLTQRQLTVRIMQECEDYANLYPNTPYKGLILHGNAGLGKSFLLSCMCERLQSRGYGATAVSSYQLMEKLRSIYFNLDDAEEYRAELIDSPALLIDDLGSEPMARNSEELLCMLLNERMNRGKFTVITTNLMQAQFKERYSERVMSRLADRRFWDHLVLKGEDLRRA